MYARKSGRRPTQLNAHDIVVRIPSELRTNVQVLQEISRIK